MTNTISVIESDGSTAEVPLYAGYTASATFTPAAAAYLANDVFEGAKQLTGIGPALGGEVLITASSVLVAASALATSENSYTLHLYSVMPPSAPADNAAWDLPSGDRASYLGKVLLGTPVDVGSSLWVQQNTLNIQVTVPTGGNLFALLTTDAAFPPTAAARTVTLKSVAL